MIQRAYFSSLFIYLWNTIVAGRSGTFPKQLGIILVFNDVMMHSRFMKTTISRFVSKIWIMQEGHIPLKMCCFMTGYLTFLEGVLIIYIFWFHWQSICLLTFLHQLVGDSILHILKFNKLSVHLCKMKCLNARRKKTTQSIAHEFNGMKLLQLLRNTKIFFIKLSIFSGTPHALHDAFLFQTFSTMK